MTPDAPTPAAGRELREELARLPPPGGAARQLAELSRRLPRDWLESELERIRGGREPGRVGDQARRLLRTLRPAPDPMPVSPASLGRALEAGGDEALDALGHLPELPSARARGLLAAALRGPRPDPWVRARLASSLGSLGGEDAPEELTLLLEDPSPRVVANALEALARREPGTGLHAAYHRLESRENRVRAAAVAAVGAVNPSFGVALTRDMASSPDPWMRASACHLARSLPDEEAEAVLLEVLLRSTEPRLLARALESLAERGGPAAAEALGHLTGHPDPVLAGVARQARERLRARIGEVGEPGEGRESFASRRRQVLTPDGPQGDAEASVLADLVASVAGESGEGEPLPEAEAIPEAEEVAPAPSPSPPSGEPRGEPTRLNASTRPRPPHDTRAHDLRPAGKAAGPPGEAVVREVREALRELDLGRPREAVERLQVLLPTDGSGVPQALAWALAICFLRAGEVGLALPYVRGLDPLRLGLEQHYALGVCLDEAGAVPSALACLEALRARRLRYRDVQPRLESLRLREGRVPEEVWLQLARRYRNLSPLGTGGMGRVFRATERATGRVVAVKVPGEETLRSEELRERLLREMDALSRIQHPSVVRIFEVSDGAVPFYSMELVEGRSLGARMEEGPLSPAAALGVLAPIADALAHLHSCGMIHRDVKPENILLDASGVPKLTDFGIAFVDSRTSMTQTGRMMGTLGYMSPEQIEGKDPTSAVDVYSFGVVLYEALTGALPFPARSAVLKVYRDAPRVEEAAPGTPVAVGDLVADCLARLPEARLADGGALRDALRRVVAG